MVLVTLIATLIFGFGNLPIDETTSTTLEIGFLVACVVLTCIVSRRAKKMEKEEMPVAVCPRCGTQFSMLQGAFQFCPNCGAATGNPSLSTEPSR